MPTFIIRHIDPAFWARVQAKAHAEGVQVKALILRLLAAWLGVLLAVLATGCGGAGVPTAPSPVTPIPTFDLSGPWAGTYAFALDGTFYEQRLTATIAQTPDAVTLTFQSEAGPRGTITGQVTDRTVMGQMSGMLTLDVPSDDPARRCHGTGALSGPVAPQIVWTAPSIAVTDCLGEITQVVITLRRSVFAPSAAASGR